MSETGIDNELLEEFVQETVGALEGLDSLFIKLEDGFDADTISTIFRTMHTAKGNSATLGLDHIKEFTHIQENLLDRVRQEKVAINPEIIDLMLNGKDLLQDLMSRQLEDPTLNALNEEEKALIEAIAEVHDEVDLDEYQKLIQCLKNFSTRWQEVFDQGNEIDISTLLSEIQAIVPDEEEVETDSTVIEDVDSKSSLKVESAHEKEKIKDQEKPVEKSENTSSNKPSIRVEQEAIDDFLNEVGELVTLVEGLNHFGSNIAKQNIPSFLTKEFQGLLLSFQQRSLLLQKTVLNVRKVSVKSLLQKIPRMVRSLAKGLNKQVNVVIEGEDTSLDRSLIDQLEDPLIHFVRNSMDHGIEIPQRRSQKGKDAKGTLKISAHADEKNFYLVIEDDGNGIDPEKMREIAVKKNLMSLDEANRLSDHEAQEIIFMPGFSTAEHVTDVSGRGVGMDVVMSSVHAAKGQVFLESKVDEGSRFTLQLPLIGTTVVTKSMKFRVGDNLFVIPLEFIQEVVLLEENFVSTILGRESVFSWRDQQVRVTNLHEFLSIEKKSDDPTKALLVAKYKKHLQAFVVNEILGVQQAVIKKIPEHTRSTEFISGAALMGDGSIAMVLNCPAVLQQA